MSDDQARIGLALGGAAIGAYFGVPGVGLAVGTLAGTLLFPGKDPPPILGPRLDELLQQTSTYGKFIPNIEGVFRVAGNVVWAPDIREVSNSEKDAGGGKGGPPKQESVSFSYFLTMDVDLCEGPIAGIRRIWMNDQFYTNLVSPTAGNPLNIRTYPGSETQLPDPVIEAELGVGNVPASRGKAHVVIIDFPLSRSQNSVPVFHFEVVAAGTTQVTPVTIADTGQVGGLGAIAIDDETGLIWVARGAANEVRIFSCDAEFALIKTLDHESADACAWCPGFLSIRSSLLSPQFIENPGRVWVTAGIPDAFSGSRLIGYTTDGGYQADIGIRPFNGSLFCWPGQVIVDKSSISTVFPNQNQVTVGLVGVTNGACGGIRAYNLDDTFPKVSNTFVGYNFIVGGYIVDWVEGEDDIIYSTDSRGGLYKLKKGVPFDVSDLDKLAVEYYVNDTATTTTGTPQFFSKNSVTFDPDAKQVYTVGVYGGGQRASVKKWDSQLNEIWTTEYSIFDDPSNSFFPEAVRYHRGVGDIWLFGRGLVNGVGSGMSAVRISSEDGRILDHISTGLGTTGLGAVEIYPGSPFAIMTHNLGVTKIPLVSGATPVPPRLKDVLTRYAVRTRELVIDDVDVTDVPDTDLVTGYAIPTRMPMSNAARPLLQAYFVDIVERNGKVAFVKRGGTSVRTIPKEDLSARGFGQALPAPTTFSRTQDNELPREVNVRFTNANDEYKVGAGVAKRLTTGSFQVRTVDMPIVFTPDQAQQIADTLLYNIWNDRDPRDIIISRKYLELIPTDIVTLEDPDLGFITVRINRVEYHFPQLMKIQAVLEDITVYAGFTFPGGTPLAPLIPFPPDANLRLFILDIPNVRDADNNIGVYVGAHGLTGTYRSGQVFRSLDALNFDPVVGLPNEATVAAVPEALTWSGSFK